MLGLLAAVMLASGPGTPTTTYADSPRVSYYEPTGFRMANGLWPDTGWAACGAYYYEQGFSGVTVTTGYGSFSLLCGDTGRLGYRQVDVFSWSGRPWWLDCDFCPVEGWY